MNRYPKEDHIKSLDGIAMELLLRRTGMTLSDQPKRALARARGTYLIIDEKINVYADVSLQRLLAVPSQNLRSVEIFKIEGDCFVEFRNKSFESRV